VPILIHDHSGTRRINPVHSTWFDGENLDAETSIQKKSLLQAGISEKAASMRAKD
jgi:hypothetical protein